ncbi:hypothetical protein TcCL_ESM03073 [Trypanosoma cruzi]|nr:hypothetical protein TcCL_ESM03073 [Trypanosoma cruzi]
MPSFPADANSNELNLSLSAPVELQHVEERIARRRSTLPELSLPDTSGGIPVSKNSSFVEANFVADPQKWNHRFTGAFTSPVKDEPVKEKTPAPMDSKVKRPPTPEITCCSLFF